MPFRRNGPHRDQIPRARYKVTTWAGDTWGLVQRGDLRFRISEDALEGWIAPYRRIPGGRRKPSNLALEATRVLGAASKRPLRQTAPHARLDQAA